MWDWLDLCVHVRYFTQPIFSSQTTHGAMWPWPETSPKRCYSWKTAQEEKGAKSQWSALLTLPMGRWTHLYWIRRDSQEAWSWAAAGIDLRMVCLKRGDATSDRKKRNFIAWSSDWQMIPQKTRTMTPTSTIENILWHRHTEEWSRIQLQLKLHYWLRNTLPSAYTKWYLLLRMMTILLG